MKLNPKQREEIRMMFGGRCAYCGVPLTSRWCTDHVEPIYRRSKWMHTETGYKLVQTGECDMPHRDTIDNLFPCCNPCNIHKGPLSLITWRKQLEDLVGILERNYPTFRCAVRFGRVAVVSADHLSPVVFWFEKFRQERP